MLFQWQEALEGSRHLQKGWGTGGTRGVTSRSAWPMPASFHPDGCSYFVRASCGDVRETGGEKGLVSLGSCEQQVG